MGRSSCYHLRMRRVLTYLLLIVTLFAVVELLFVFSKKPESDRTWMPEQAETAHALDAGSLVTIFNVRDWTYDASGILSTEWTSATLNPKDIVRTWFIIEPFSDWEAVGHTFLSFELEDGRVYSFSVEARREEGEEYSAVRGLFNEYELSYQWGTERDFITRRLLYLDHPLRLYPLSLSPEASEALFRSLVAETNALAAKPRFYNTLSANCTNVLAKIVNRHHPGTLPWSTSWYLTGYADEYLMEEGLIELSRSVDETKAAHDLTAHRASITSFTSSSPIEFSRRLREQE